MAARPEFDPQAAVLLSTLLDEMMIELSATLGAPQVTVAAIEGVALAFTLHLRRLEFEGPAMEMACGVLAERFETALGDYARGLPDEVEH